MKMLKAADGRFFLEPQDVCIGEAARILDKGTASKDADRRLPSDGEPFRMVSGAIHYFRVVPGYWRDRLLKLQACGFNTVETYIPWNLHEPKEGEFCFNGLADVAGFVQLAGELGLHVILRPSPYICAEWEFGGLPPWLLGYPGIRLRCMDPVYLSKVDAYYDALIPVLLPLLSTRGGPVLAMQIENEYGSYGNDKAYLDYLRQGLTRRGVDVLLFTSDGPEDGMLQGGTLPGTLATVNFGSRPEEAFQNFRQYRPADPLVCMEYWNGWFDHWLTPHHTREAGDTAEVLDRMLTLGASVNFYMFHGGTNFGFYNGANYDAKYEATVTSYDYDAPLSESGEYTPKYEAVKQVLEKHFGPALVELPKPAAKCAYGEVLLTERLDLLDIVGQLSVPVTRTVPEAMEGLGQGYGFILYETILTGPRTGEMLHLQEVHDRALVFLDEIFLGTVERWDSRPLPVTVPPGGARLRILVENMGRINYGPRLTDRKGITEGVRLNNQFQFGWTIYPLPFASVADLPFAAAGEEKSSAVASGENRPALYRGGFHAEVCGDSFVRLEGWTKGVVWVNGFNLGRYWSEGPQQTLYLPGPLLRAGWNELIVLELHHTDKAKVVLQETPELGNGLAAKKGEQA